MMNAMMLRSINDQLERSEVTNECCMNPQLIYQVELIVDDKVRRRYKEGQRQIEHLQKDVN